MPMQWRDRLAAVVENRRFQQFIIAVIVFNAITLAMGTSQSIMASNGDLLHVLDQIMLAVFVAELVMKLTAYGPKFFADGWNAFYYGVVAMALIPASWACDVL